MQVTRIPRPKKTVKRLGMDETQDSAGGNPRLSIAIKTFHSFNYRQKRRAVNNKRDIFLGTYLEPVRFSRRRACPILG
jgi:hypothetical protein